MRDLQDLRIELLAFATQIAMQNAQITGPQREYFITLRQLEILLRGQKT